jgi:hypothetical protein
VSAVVAWLVFLAPYAIAFSVGLLLIPGLVYGLGSEYPDIIAGATARVLWTIGMLAYGASIVYQRSGRQFELLAADIEDVDGGAVLTTSVDGETVTVPGSRADLGRLGKRPIGFAAEKSPEMLQRFGAVTDADDIKTTVRQGYKSFNPFPDHEGWFIPLRRFKSELLDSAGSYLIDKAEEEAIVDAGGANELGPYVFIGAMFLALILGGAMSLASMVVVG